MGPTKDSKSRIPDNKIPVVIFPRKQKLLFHAYHPFGDDSHESFGSFVGLYTKSYGYKTTEIYRTAYFSLIQHLQF